MGFLSLLRGAFTELIRDPKLFIPKMVSVTIYIPPYLLLARITAEIARNPLAAEALLEQTTWLTVIIFALAPIWLFVDSMYPVLVQQRSKTGKINFRGAASHVLGKFLKIIALFLAVFIILTLINIPFIGLLAAGMVFQLLPLIFLGLLGTVIVVFAAGIFLYFVPTALILEKIGIIESFRSGLTLSRKNFNLVFWLTLASFVLLLLGFYLEGAFERLGEIGFIIGRYVGGVLTVYLYVINPSAYLEVRPRGKKRKRKK
jgi:hypothetical protein